MIYRIFLSIVFSLLFFAALAQDKTQYTPSDVAKVVPVPYKYENKAPYKGFEYTSFYLTMRDGVKIAVDLYLPKGLEEGKKIPTIMHQTRYWRSLQTRWPFSWFIGNLFGPLQEFVENFTSQGYAVVNVDSRGSGASFGHRPHPWTMDEVKDGAEIADWIIEQDWSNGNIGAAGASYSGTTSEFLLVNNHPNVKAVVNMYSLFDVYDDNAFPGGNHNIWFTSVWGAANEQLDKNELPTKSRKARMAIKGVRPVEGERDLLKQAVIEHRQNLNVNDGALTVDFRDDTPESGAVETMDIFSPHTYVEKEDASGAAIYSYSGWMDGAYQHGAIKRYLTLTNPENKLLIGPWEHGGQYNTSPFNPGKSGFDHFGELLKFFDYHLMGEKNNLYKEPPVHYFTMGEERWKSSYTWPPKSAKYEPVYFSADSSLEFDYWYADYLALQAQIDEWQDSLNKLPDFGSIEEIMKKAGTTGINLDSVKIQEEKIQEWVRWGGVYMKFREKIIETEAEMKALNPDFVPDQDHEPAFDTYEVDTTFGSGTQTRWESVAGKLKSEHVYADWQEKTGQLLSYTSPPLVESMEVTGHPLVTLYVSSEIDDGSFFVYLEDVDENGQATYVTEGFLRAIHRDINNDKREYKDGIPFYRTYEREDARPLVPGKIAELKFDMLPTSYLFKKGHRLRVSVAGADTDHFRVMVKKEPEVKIYRSFDFTSKVELPVVR